MTTALKATEIVDAAIALILAAVGTTITFSPVIVQEGNLRFYAENPDGVSLEVPAIFVRARAIDLHTADGSSYTDLHGGLTGTQTELRIVVVDKWEVPDDVVEKRIQHGQEVAQAFLNSPRLDLDASIPGYLVIPPSTARAIEFYPPEDNEVSQSGARQLFAVAVTVQVQGRAART